MEILDAVFFYFQTNDHLIYKIMFNYVFMFIGWFVVTSLSFLFLLLSENRQTKSIGQTKSRLPELIDIN